MNGYTIKPSTGTEKTIISGIAAPTSTRSRPENAAMQAISSANAPIIVMPPTSIQLIFIGVQLGAYHPRLKNRESPAPPAELQKRGM
jgi:hypothetical protein